MKTQPFAANLECITKDFGGVRALDNVSFNVKEGEVHCLAGENGSGKSTLIKIIAGVHELQPDARIELFGNRVTDISPATARSLGIRVIWQDLALFPHMSIAENIAFDQVVGTLPRIARLRSSRKQAADILSSLGVSLDLDASLNTLPISQRQIVAIARALMGNARLIFMDEPTASLTQAETDRLVEIVRELSVQGVAVVFVSHRLAEVLDVSSRVTVLRDGKLVGVYSTEGMSQTRLGELMTGTTLSSNVNARDQSGSPIAMRIDGLSRFGEFEDVSLHIHAGEIVGLTGLIGAGRTELAHVIIGMRAADTGTIQLNGNRVIPKSIRDAIRLGIAYVSEDRLSLGLIQPQTIADNVSISVIDRELATGPGLISVKRKNKLVADWVDKLGIKIGKPTDSVATLSGGNQQKVVLAKWLATNPRLLILDSPTVGVDVGARAGIFRIVRELANQGIAILLISDELLEVLNNSDRVLHMAGGRIVGEYDPHQTDVVMLESAVYA